MLLLNHNWTLNLIAVLLLIKSDPESVDSHIRSLSCVSFLHSACTADVPKAVFCITVSRMPAFFLVALSGFSLENPCFVLLLLSSRRLAICVYYHFKGFQNMLPKDCSWKCVNAGTFTGCRLCVSPLSWINDINKTFWNLQKLKRSLETVGHPGAMALTRSSLWDHPSQQHVPPVFPSMQQQDTRSNMHVHGVSRILDRRTETTWTAAAQLHLSSLTWLFISPSFPTRSNKVNWTHFSWIGSWPYAGGKHQLSTKRAISDTPCVSFDIKQLCVRAEPRLGDWKV